MRVLITNDDSISATQLLPLVRYCRKLGDVTVAVPLKEQSGKSHGIELHSPFCVAKQMLDNDVAAYVIDSTPADCVRYALLGLGLKFDLVISGINRGFNMGTDVMYSGTVAAVREAALQKTPAIAISTCPEYYEESTKHLDLVFDYFEKRKLLDIHNVYNVNIPHEPKGIVITRQGCTYYTDQFVKAGEGLVKAQGKCVYTASGDLSLDTDAVMSGYVSIMPITIDMTDKEIFKKITQEKQD